MILMISIQSLKTILKKFKRGSFHESKDVERGRLKWELASRASRYFSVIEISTRSNLSTF